MSISSPYRPTAALTLGGVTDTDLDVLDVEQAGVEVTSLQGRAGSSALLLVALCVGMGVLVGIMFAVWFFVGNALFGAGVPAFMEWLGWHVLTGR